jgi:hypothetical protein
MHPSLLLPALAALALWPDPPPTVDLGKIDRRLAREPVYQSNAPKYCLLVFGPEARTRVWLVLDGNTLYADRNGNGDLTEKNKALPIQGGWVNIGEIAEPDRKVRHTNLRLRRYGEFYRLTVQAEGTRRMFVGYDEEDPLRFADRAADAPVVHIDGPLTMRLYGEPPVFVAGQRNQIDISVGTPGLGKGSFASLQCCTILNCNVAPIAEVTFPHRDPGREPLRARVSTGDD